MKEDREKSVDLVKGAILGKVRKLPHRDVPKRVDILKRRKGVKHTAKTNLNERKKSMKPQSGDKKKKMPKRQKFPNLPMLCQMRNVQSIGARIKTQPVTYRKLLKMQTFADYRCRKYMESLEG